MWEFTVHRFSSSIRWTWVRVGSGGRAIAKSLRAFPTWTEACTDAVANGFNSATDHYDLIELPGTPAQTAMRRFANTA
jgi:hypothetical protein